VHHADLVILADPVILVALAMDKKLHRGEYFVRRVFRSESNSLKFLGRSFWPMLHKESPFSCEASESDGQSREEKLVLHSTRPLL
jgi:hypothetical protein